MCGGAGRCWRRVERGCDDVAAVTSGSRCAVGGSVTRCYGLEPAPTAIGGGPSEPNKSNVLECGGIGYRPK
jgi:hypothetical protein